MIGIANYKNNRLYTEFLSNCNSDREDYPRIIDYVAKAIDISRKEEPDSEFFKRNPALLTMPLDQLGKVVESPYFLKQNYDVMFSRLTDDEEKAIIGHIAFQKHDSYDETHDWRTFHHYIGKRFRHNGFGTMQARILIEHARNRGVKRAHLCKGNGGNKMDGIVERLSTEERGMGIFVDLESYWIEILGCKNSSAKNSST